VNTAFTYVTTVGMMLYLNPRLTFFSMLPYPILLYVFNRLSKRMHDQSVAAQQELSALSAQIQESLSGILLVKAYGREAHEAAAFERANDRYMQASLALERTEGIAFPVVGAVGGMATVLLMALGGRDVISGRITLGEFVAFNSYLGMLLWPTIGLGWILNVLERGLAAMGRLEEIFQQDPAITDPIDPVEVSSLQGELELRNLTFAYRPVAAAPERRVLDGVSAHIPRGSVCAIVGGTGSGKTTLVHLLARFYARGRSSSAATT
ncbi:MAG: ATP-binding cassette domain-containing protein, partial [Candidatus Wallbacteria bacterium]|nr:ATP-binding cassette domain-containing protein [Candidatus Wallbacteria bacterium]